MAIARRLYSCLFYVSPISLFWWLLFLQNVYTCFKFLLFFPCFPLSLIHACVSHVGGGFLCVFFFVLVFSFIHLLHFVWQCFGICVTLFYFHSFLPEKREEEKKKYVLNFIRGSHDNVERDRNMSAACATQYIYIHSCYSIRDCRDSFFFFFSVSSDVVGCWCALIEAAGGAWNVTLAM